MEGGGRRYSYNGPRSGCDPAATELLSVPNTAKSSNKGTTASILLTQGRDDILKPWKPVTQVPIMHCRDHRPTIPTALSHRNSPQNKRRRSSSLRCKQLFHLRRKKSSKKYTGDTRLLKRQFFSTMRCFSINPISSKQQVPYLRYSNNRSSLKKKKLCSHGLKNGRSMDHFQ